MVLLYRLQYITVLQYINIQCIRKLHAKNRSERGMYDGGLYFRYNIKIGTTHSDKP